MKTRCLIHEQLFQMLLEVIMGKKHACSSIFQVSQRHVVYSQIGLANRALSSQYNNRHVDS